MKLLPIGDGSRYIDLSTAHCFDVRGITYCKSQHGVWVRREKKDRSGQAIPEREAFKAFIIADMLTEAEKNFPELFKDGFNVQVTIEPGPSPTAPTPRHLWRFMLGGLVGLALAAYVAAAIMGSIPASRQISLADVAIIVIGLVLIVALFQPQLLLNVQQFRFGSFRVDLREQLQEIQDTQKSHGENLDEIHFILRALVTTGEMVHLKMLAYGSTSNYQRAPSLLDELRRLRAIGLIEPVKKNYKIAGLPAKFDLAHYVRLTDRGIDYLERVGTAVPPPDAPASPDRASR